MTPPAPANDPSASNTGKLDRRALILWAGLVGALTVGGNYFASLAVRDPETPGYGVDPNLLEKRDFWPSLLTADQRLTVAAFGDYLLPAEGNAPSASAIQIHDMIDEWVSAPYPDQLADRKLILNGLDWINEEAKRRTDHSFVVAPQAVQAAIFGTLDGSSPPGSVLPPSGFYARLRKLVICGYYTTEAGFADIGYIGNQALKSFPRPSSAVLAFLGDAYRRLGLDA